MTTLWSFLFVLGVLVFVHELGHFLVARWYGVRVITFSLGFGPKIFKFTRGGTEYCISIVPLGGYVKLAGELAEDNRTGAPDEFLSKSKWVRFQVYIAGPVMNVALAVLVMAGVLAQWGKDVPLYESSAPVIGIVAEDSPAAAGGLAVGDRILSVDGRDVPTWTSLSMEVALKAGRELALVVDRAGEQVALSITPSSVGRDEIGEIGVGPMVRPQIQAVIPGSPADRGGLRGGDVILAVGDASSPSGEELRARIQESADTALSFLVERDGREVPLSVVPEGPSGAATVGIHFSNFETRRVNPTVIEALGMSAQQNWEGTLLIGRTLRGLLTGDTPMRQLAGPVRIAEMSGDAARTGWEALLVFVAMLSLNLGLINLVPIPVLDGGHILILAVEGLARRDLSLRVKERILTAGAVAIVLLMITVMFNDVSRLLR